MKATQVQVVAFLVLAQLQGAVFAGPVKGSASVGASRSVSSVGRLSTASKISGFKPSTGRTLAPPARRSVLAGAVQPSQQVTQIIREREMSGAGIVGIAFLAALLSQHDLSSSDRSWLEGKIAELKTSGEGELGLIAPAASSGLKLDSGNSTLEAGAVLLFTLRDENARNLEPVRCSIDGNATEPTVRKADSRHVVSWTPESPGVYILQCRTAVGITRRLIKVL